MGSTIFVWFIMTGCADIAESELSRPQGIGGALDVAREDPNVFFFEDFEDEDYENRFTQATHQKNRRLVTGDAVFNGENSLRITVNKDSHNGSSLRFQFAKAGLSEPIELYARYYLRFDESWNAEAGGGKLPGPAGTYGRAGWGGRRSDGSNGWSARMRFGRSWFGPEFVDIGYYTYHADTTSRYGDTMHWRIGNRGSLQKNRWYCIETYVKMNTVGKSDGILRGWVDGYLAIKEDDIVFRTLPEIKIEEFWVNIYYGGRYTAPNDMHLYIDNLALSTERIGTALPRPD